MSLVAIVGRPNVGKSTLFNRLVGQRKAIVDATAGTTRDRHYGKTDWNGREFSVIDTGGYSVNSDDIFEDDIRRQVMLAIEEADVILFLVEVNTGITDLDQMMADILRRTSKKVLLVCNKVDNYDLIYSSHEFYSLGLGEPYCISSMSGSARDRLNAVAALTPARKHGIYDPSTGRGLADTPTALTCVRSALAPSSASMAGRAAVWWNSASLCRRPSCPSLTGKNFLQSQTTSPASVSNTAREVA